MRKVTWPVSGVAGPRRPVFLGLQRAPGGSARLLDFVSVSDETTPSPTSTVRDELLTCLLILARHHGRHAAPAFGAVRPHRRAPARR